MEKKYKLIWSISLLTISCITITISGCHLLSIELPDMVERILGIIDLIAIPVLIFTSVKLRVWKNGNEEKTESDRENR